MINLFRNEGKLKKPKATSGDDGNDQAVDKVPRKRRQAATVGGDKTVSDGVGNKRKRDAVQEDAALPIMPLPVKMRKTGTEDGVSSSNNAEEDNNDDEEEEQDDEEEDEDDDAEEEEGIEEGRDEDGVEDEMDQVMDTSPGIGEQEQGEGDGEEEGLGGGGGGEDINAIMMMQVVTDNAGGAGGLFGAAAAASSSSLSSSSSTSSGVNIGGGGIAVGAVVKKQNKPNARATGWDKVHPALLTYKRIHGNLAVHRSFIIPQNSPDYPPNTWGVKLGQLKESIRRGFSYKDYRNELLEMGFEFSNRKNTLVEWPRLHTALTVYKQIHGHLDVNPKYVIPNSQEFPQETWGIRLGRILYTIQNQKAHLQHHDELIAMGVEMAPFPIEPQMTPWEILRPALVNWHRIHGTFEIPIDFEVPSGTAEFPDQATWGMNLGKIFHTLKQTKGQKVYVEELRSIGFEYAKVKPQKRTAGWERVKEALLTYKALKGNLEVKREFIVPSNTEYPEGTWGLKLGDMKEAIKRGHSYKDHRTELLEMGFPFERKKTTTGWPRLKTAIVAYKEAHGNLYVPFNFVVPDNDPNYPPDAWGVKLGWGLNTMKYQGCFKAHVEELIQLGFDMTKRNAGGSRATRLPRGASAEVAAAVANSLLSQQNVNMGASSSSSSSVSQHQLMQLLPQQQQKQQTVMTGGLVQPMPMSVLPQQQQQQQQQQQSGSQELQPQSLQSSSSSSQQLPQPQQQYQQPMMMTTANASLQQHLLHAPIAATLHIHHQQYQQLQQQLGLQVLQGLAPGHGLAPGFGLAPAQGLAPLFGLPTGPGLAQGLAQGLRLAPGPEFGQQSSSGQSLSSSSSSSSQVSGHGHVSVNTLPLPLSTIREQQNPQPHQQSQQQPQPPQQQPQPQQPQPQQPQQQQQQLHQLPPQADHRDQGQAQSLGMMYTNLTMAVAGGQMRGQGLVQGQQGLPGQSVAMGGPHPAATAAADTTASHPSSSIVQSSSSSSSSATIAAVTGAPAVVYPRPLDIPVHAPQNNATVNALGSLQMQAPVSSHQHQQHHHHNHHQQQQQQPTQPAPGMQQQQQQPSTSHAPLDYDNVTINVMPLIAAISTVSGGVVGLGVEELHPVADSESNIAARQSQSQGSFGQGQV